MLKRLFSGTSALILFILRRDRVRIPAWLLLVAGFTVACVPLFNNMFGSADELQGMAEMMQNPAMIAMVGPVYGLDNYHMGAMYTNFMLVLMAMLAGAMNIFFVTRHTRQDEEFGRLEVVRSLPVGRLANLAATMLTAVKMNAVMALLIGFGMVVFGVDGVTLSGSLIFGAAMGAAGLVFAAATAVFCQISGSNRTASGMALFYLVLAYMLRAAGDVGAEALSLISPLGLTSRTQAFVGNYLWPIWVLLGAAVAFAVLALVFAKVRDLGQGMVAARPGRRHAGRLLSGPLGLALRLSKTTLLVWGFVLVLFGVMYGSVMDQMDTFIGENETLQQMFAAGITDGASYTDEFVALLMVLMSAMATIPVLGLMLRLRSEEKQGYLERVLAGSVSRVKMFGVYFGIALVASTVFKLISILSLWSAASIVLDAPPALGTYLSAGLNYLPAMWVLLGLATLLIGFFPKRTGLAYGYLGLSFFLVYMGNLIGFPDWVIHLSPFGNIPRLPLEAQNWVPLLVLAGISAVLVGLGLAGYRKRDLT
ncbi:MAG: ABC transporter permease [Oscillospiraceae bacterium]|nr:ABC transporter permease [Oscillospiraceae bacterium]